MSLVPFTENEFTAKIRFEQNHRELDSRNACWSQFNEVNKITNNVLTSKKNKTEIQELLKIILN